MRSVCLAGVAFTIACSGSDVSGIKDSGNPSCEVSCFEGWWYLPTGPCEPFCESADPDSPDPPPECQDPDCRLLEARRYATSGELITLRAILFSETMGSFTQLLPPRMDTWTLAGECHFEGSNGPSDFVCDGDTFRVSGTQLSRPGPSLAAAFDAALTDGGVCRHTL
jgi:hypothetical protein